MPSYAESKGSGPKIVLLHAFPLNPTMWQPQIAALGDQFRILAPRLYDLRGDDSRPIDTVVDMADAVADWLDHQMVREPVIVGGLSMGGYVALAFARRHARRLRGLILADTKAEKDNATARANRYRAIAVVQEQGVGALIDEMMPKMISPDSAHNQPHLADHIRAMAIKQSDDEVVAAIKALRDRPNSTPSLSKIAVPTLVIVGEKDLLTPPALSEALARAIPHATLSVIPGAGHLSNLEQPAAFNSALIDFVSKCEA
jgi:pimeloyl-ACP methyl ester carboxylesterase